MVLNLKSKLSLSLVLLLLNLGLNKSYAQKVPINDSTQIHDLTIGDKVPDHVFTKVQNYPGGKIDLSKLKSKLIILDFWNTWCLSCIEAMPEMEKLQEKYGDRIQIILVTKDKAEAIKKLKSDIVHNVRLPMIIGDTFLSNHFAYKSVPTHAWIDSTGEVNQITDGWNTTEKNIDTYLNGNSVSLALKAEKRDFQYGVPLWLEGNGRQYSHLEYYSFLMNKVTDGKLGGYGIGTDSNSKKKNRFWVNNLPILNLYKLAFQGDSTSEFNFDNRTILDLNHPEVLIDKENKDLDGPFKNYKLYCYDLKIPVSRSDQLFPIMKQDLERFFGLYGRFEKRKVKCLSLIRTSNIDKIHTKGGPAKYECNVDGNIFLFKNQPIGMFVKGLIYTNDLLTTPIFDGTNYENYIDLNVNCKLNDLPALRRELKRYDLDLIEDYRDLKMLVISDH